MGYVTTENGLSSVGVSPFENSFRRRMDIAAAASLAKAAKPQTIVVPSATKGKPVVIVQPARIASYYWLNTQTGLTAVRTNATPPTGTGWVRYPTSVALAEARAAWLRSKAVPTKPFIFVKPPTDFLRPPVIYPKPPIDTRPTILPTAGYWWVNRATEEIRQSVYPPIGGSWQAFTTQLAARSWLASQRKPVPSLPPQKGRPTVVTLPTGDTVAAKPVVTTGGEVVSVPAGTTVPVVTAAGDVRQMDAMAVAAAKPVEAGDGKIFGLPSNVVWIGGAALLLFVLLPMMTKKGR